MPVSTAVLCYECRSHFSMECADPFQHAGTHRTECDRACAKMKKVSKLADGSATTVQIWRQCYTPTFPKDGCIVKTDSEDDSTTTLCSCHEKLCNNAPKLATGSGRLLFLINSIMAAYWTYCEFL
ncbi:protein quiver isoform X2 [Lingula anatina]|uniref:UPAR/Ly6 domain-containing protein qvr n=1 Tax=Lingula anatina TaxID=7574 RepID=A0A1S3JXJ1_LINAN|nr:protein quiver isoform X2 [Lingula anatina]|eukprot:XP_013415027.1 protein quiver isoform X2 [Lingula anatina]